MKKIFRTKFIVYIVLLCLLSVSIICFAISYKKVAIGMVLWPEQEYTWNIITRDV